MATDYIRLTIPPRSIEAAIAAKRIAVGERIAIAIAFQGANEVELRPAVLAAKRADGAKLLLVGAPHGAEYPYELTAAQWVEFLDWADNGVIVGHCLHSIIDPAIRESLARVARRGGAGLARRYSAMPRADLLEVLSWLRETVAPWAAAALDPNDGRLNYARGEGRHLLTRLSTLESLSISQVAPVLVGEIRHPKGASDPERKASATDSVWRAIAPGLIALSARPDEDGGPIEEIPESVAVDAAASAGAATDWRTMLLTDEPTPSPAAKALGVAPATAAFLAARGLADPNRLAELKRLDPDEMSHNPYLLKGMEETAERVRRAITNREPITIFGDYDADGIPGTALLATFLRHAGADVTTVIARREHGYGLLPEAAESLLQGTPPSLVITVDCGTSNHDSIKYLQQVGKVDVAVLDHHLALQGNPPTPYYVNPMRSDGETYPFRYLCGCGVAYKLVQALSSNRHEPALYELVAISTIGDQMPLVGENRFYVAAALERLRRTGQGNLGLTKLSSMASRPMGAMSPDDLAYAICPRINAVGRMSQDPNNVVELLTTSDSEQAERLAAELDETNQERRTLTDELIKRALETIGDKPDPFIVSYLPDLPVGVAGLVAGRLVSEYGRPVLVVNAEGKGSGRAPAGSTIIEYMEQLKRMPKMENLSFGGHAAACGFNGVDPRNLVQAARKLKPKVGDMVDRPSSVDATLRLGDLSVGFCQELDELAPYLAGQRAPSFLLSGINIAASRRTGTEKKPGDHLRLSLTDAAGAAGEAIWFGAADQMATLPERADIVGVPTLSSWGKRTSVIFRVTRLVRAA